MDEIDALTKRFKDYVDKVQAAYDAASSNDEAPDRKSASVNNSPRKMYTVVSPVEAMASNVRAVLKAIDNAIHNIDELASDGQDVSTAQPEGKGVYSPRPGEKKFTDEELDFLVQTFNKILKASSEERKRLFKHFDK